MLKKYGFVLMVSIIAAQPVFADDMMDSDDKACVPIVKACLDWL